MSLFEALLEEIFTILTPITETMKSIMRRSEQDYPHHEA